MDVKKLAPVFVINNNQVDVSPAVEPSMQTYRPQRGWDIGSNIKKSANTDALISTRQPTVSVRRRPSSTGSPFEHDKPQTSPWSLTIRRCESPISWSECDGFQYDYSSANVPHVVGPFSLIAHQHGTPYFILSFHRLPWDYVEMTNVLGRATKNIR